MRWSIALLLLSSPLYASSPAFDVQLAWADARKDPADAHYWRYLALYATPKEKRAELWRVLSYHSNTLSREPQITPLALIMQAATVEVVGFKEGVPVDAAGAGVPDDVLDSAELLRIDVRWFGKNFAVAWDFLNQFDPFFHVKLQKSYQYQESGGCTWYWVDGQWTKDKPADFIYAHAPWLFSDAEYAKIFPVAKDGKAYYDKAAVKGTAIGNLIDLLQTTTPIVHAHWFLFQTGIQEDRAPAGYQNFLGLKTEADFFKAVGFNARVLEDFPQEAADCVAFSTVTDRNKPRAVVVLTKPGTKLYITLDVDRPVERSSPQRVFDPRFNLVVFAKEELGSLPNELWAGVAVNAKDNNLQATVPPNIAHDRFGENNDFNVHGSVLGCMRCHTKGGLNDVRFFVRNKVNKNPLSLKVLADDYFKKDQERLARIYRSDVDGWMQADRASTDRAVLLACGKDSKWAYSKTASWFESSRYPVGADRAARDLGVTRERMVAGFRRFLKETKTLDPVLATYIFVDEKRVKSLKADLADLADEDVIQAEVWFEAYPLAQFAMRGVVPLEN